MTDVISSDSSFPVALRENLARLASAMIPEEGEHPAGGHPDILGALLEHLAGKADLVREGMQTLEALAEVEHSQTLGALADAQCLALLPVLMEQQPAFYYLLQSSLLTAYYQHPATLDAVGVAPRPPYPAGREVRETDWSLLDPVRTRAPFYREVT